MRVNSIAMVLWGAVGCIVYGITGETQTAILGTGIAMSISVLISIFNRSR